jgi:hypothetical protein
VDKNWYTLNGPKKKKKKSTINKENMSSEIRNFLSKYFLEYKHWLVICWEIFSIVSRWVYLIHTSSFIYINPEKPATLEG